MSITPEETAEAGFRIRDQAFAGRKPEPVLMFVLRRTVRLPKLLDLKGPGDRWGNAFVAAFERRLAS